MREIYVVSHQRCVSSLLYHGWTLLLLAKYSHKPNNRLRYHKEASSIQTFLSLLLTTIAWRGLQVPYSLSLYTPSLSLSLWISLFSSLLLCHISISNVYITLATHCVMTHHCHSIDNMLYTWYYMVCSFRRTKDLIKNSLLFHCGIEIDIHIYSQIMVFLISNLNWYFN